MKKNFHIQTRLFEGYLKGDLSKEEEIELSEWINRSDDNYRFYKNYITDNQFLQSHSVETVQAWQKLKSQINDHNSPGERRRVIVSTWLKVAAIVVFSLLSGFFANQLINEKQYSEIANEIFIPNGEKAQIILSDGTKVFLNAGTHFSYPAAFAKKVRTVTLTGEAFFEVAENKAHPFLIKTPEFDVKVTGTSFNLNTYMEDETHGLALHTGEITILKKEQEFRLFPGEKYILNTTTNQSEIIRTDLQKSRLWTEGVIALDNLNLEEIRKILERKFDVQIILADEKYKTIRYNGQFKPYETLGDVLTLIQETSPIKFKYEINEVKREVTIK